MRRVFRRLLLETANMRAESDRLAPELSRASCLPMLAYPGNDRADWQRLT
jgi:hypothetical protein